MEFGRDVDKSKTILISSLLVSYDLVIKLIIDKERVWLIDFFSLFIMEIFNPSLPKNF